MLVSGPVHSVETLSQCTGVNMQQYEQICTAALRGATHCRQTGCLGHEIYGARCPAGASRPRGTQHGKECFGILSF